MTAVRRLRLAEALAAVTVLAMLLGWADEPESVRGLQDSEGQLVLLTSVVAIVLVRLGNRAAWIAAGFATAVSWRAIVQLGGDAGWGLRLAVLTATAATATLVWHMVAEVRENAPD
ncbi:MAG: hypothetical protein CL442_02385 [Acidimicrobiaceae bacterium]|nr:hypothetical protein [Acidimicrobiaceae bacterium]MBR11980.1 hypothetical protein [Acidimicrobiaceae bacterium]|tara:strand:- start:135 stop:482 length:348 start_codon:yes stop_codon:yes gene_type:complete